MLSEEEVIDAEIPEYAAPLDICIKGLTFIKKRGDSLSNERSMRVRQVHTLPEIGHIIKEIFLVGY